MILLQCYSQIILYLNSSLRAIIQGYEGIEKVDLKFECSLQVFTTSIVRKFSSDTDFDTVLIN